jgi:hypothetical protein
MISVSNKNNEEKVFNEFRAQKDENTPAGY